jgi:phosphonate transport system substrate-binding protein
MNQTTGRVAGPRVRRRRRRAAFLASAVLLLPLAIRPPGLASESFYTFGVFPFLFPSHVEPIFLPIVSRLSEQIAHDVHLRTTDTFEDFQTALEEERFDFAFVQPFDYVRIAAKKGYRPLVARSGPLTALLVLPDDSPVASIEDLRGRVVALPPESAAVSYLALSVLRNAGLVPGESVTILHTPNHDTCLADMLVKAAAACGTAQGPLSVFESRARVKIRVLAASDPIPGSLIVAHPRLGEDRIASARRGLLDYAPSLLSREWLPAEEAQVFVAVSDADYEPVRRIAARLGIP